MAKKVAKKKASPKARASVIKVVEETPAGEVAEVATQPTYEQAAKNLFDYCDEHGISVKHAVQHAKATGGVDALEVRCGRDVCGRVIAHAQRMEKEYRARVVEPHSPKISQAAPGAAKAKKPSASQRALLFGVSATAAIRGIANLGGFGFAEIRSVLNSLGANWVSDGTIRCQMAGNGTKRGTPARLSEDQVEEIRKLAFASK